MKVVVLGAGGIVGQHMMCSPPPDVDAVYARRTASRLYEGVDLERTEELYEFLERHRPDVVVNLAGENNVDKVEKGREAYEAINVGVPKLLARWTEITGAHLVQVSTQGVFDGLNPPYGPRSMVTPVNIYGVQKVRAEMAVMGEGDRWTIARLTFVVGVRPFRAIGRPNPVELMMNPAIMGDTDEVQRQVDDRFFSPAFAPDAAEQLWRLVLEQPNREIVHIGTPVRTTRFEIADGLDGVHVEPVSHDSFAGIAPRPLDTTWDDTARFSYSFTEGLAAVQRNVITRDARLLGHRAAEIAAFLHVPYDEAADRLGAGFGTLHGAVAEDFHAASPSTDEELLAWYRSTDAYIWELSAYHLDPGFNYKGMCEGIAVHLKGQDKTRVVALGDGIGDLTLTLAEHGLKPVYHDLAHSRTAEFALARFELGRREPVDWILSAGWSPPLGNDFADAIVALDFFEHLTDVEGWARNCAAALKPGGLLLAQNAFAIGDEDHGGSIPMHLTRNNRFEKDWDPLLESLGLVAELGGWWRKP